VCVCVCVCVSASMHLAVPLCACVCWPRVLSSVSLLLFSASFLMLALLVFLPFLPLHQQARSCAHMRVGLCITELWASVLWFTNKKVNASFFAVEVDNGVIENVFSY